MQTRLSRYILRQLVGSTLFVGFVLLAVLGLVKCLQFLELMIKAQASTKIFLKFFLLMLPDIMINVLPIACFIAVLFVYNRLMADREVIASYAAGFRISDMAKPALGWGGFLSGLILFLNVWILPNAFQQLRALEHDLKNAAPAIFIQEGVFNSFGNVMLYVREKKSARHLKGIVAYMAQQPNEEAFTITAEEGELIYHDGAPNLLLYNGNRQELEEESRKVSILFFDQTAFSLKPSKKIITPRGRKMYEMNIHELLDAAVADKSQDKRFYAELAQRVIVPLYSLTFSCLGVLFLLLTSFARTFRLSAVLYSVASVVVLESLTLLLLKLGSRSWIALGGAYVLQSVTVITSFYLLMRKQS
jgi:lipopolysaccharide export system permease protein